MINHNSSDARADFGEARLTDRITGETVSGKRTIRGRDVWVLCPESEEGDKK